MKAALIVNSSAGKFVNSKNLLNDFKMLFARHNIDILSYDLKKENIEEIIDDAARKNIETIIVAGGDGTLRSVAQVIEGRKFILGIIPAGTLNHFARDLGIPFDTEEAVKVVSERNFTDVDAGCVNGLFFLNNASLGLYPRTVKKRDEQVETLGRNKWAALVFAFAGIFRRFPLFTVELELEGKRIRRTSPVIFIGNNFYEMNLFSLGTREKLNEGKLCLYIVRCKNRWRFFVMLVHIVFNRLDQNKDFESYVTGKLNIITKKKKITAALDGEVMKLENKIHIQSLPKAIKVLVPGKKE
jgi:YegS/Rv2252/BmrU family lipid kinase